MTFHPTLAIARTGLTLEEWETTIGDFERQLAATTDSLVPIARQPLYARLAHIADGLVLLRDYYSRMPEEVAQLSTDQELLRQIRLVSARRVDLIDDLLIAVERP